jgi:hypothetical protein
MNPLQVIRNEFFHLLGTDHIAVNAQGVPIARADSRAAVEQAAPDAAAYYTGADFEPSIPVAEIDADPVAVFTPDPVLAPQTAPVDPEPTVINVTGVSASATAGQNAAAAPTGQNPTVPFDGPWIEDPFVTVVDDPFQPNDDDEPEAA